MRRQVRGKGRMRRFKRWKRRGSALSPSHCAWRMVILLGPGLGNCSPCQALDGTDPMWLQWMIQTLCFTNRRAPRKAVNVATRRVNAQLVESLSESYPVPLNGERAPDKANQDCMSRMEATTAWHEPLRPRPWCPQFVECSVFARVGFPRPRGTRNRTSCRLYACAHSDSECKMPNDQRQLLPP